MPIFYILILLIRTGDASTVHFCAVGDILLDRGIRRVIEENTYDYPFEKIADFIKTHELAFGNLECPLSATGYSTGKIYCFRGDTIFLNGLVNAGFNIFCLANNHIIDWGAAACLDTRKHIESKELFAVGVGESQSAAITPTIISCKGLKFAFIASVGAPLKEIIWPLLKPGPAQASLDTVISQIYRVRDSVDFVIVSMHWGTEYVHVPDKRQIEWAHALIDAGADLLIGHHPHVLQSIEIYNERLIAYSLGNFIFDQRKLFQRQSALLNIVFSKGRIDSISIYPVLIENFQPALASDTMFERIADLIQEISPDELKLKIFNERLLCLANDSNTIFLAPILRKHASNYKIAVYQDRIKTIDTLTNDTCICPINNQIIIDAEIIDEPTPKIFAIIRSLNADFSDSISCFQLVNGKISKVYSKYTDDHPWKIETGDIDGDSKVELLLAVNKKARFSKNRTNRIQIFSFNDQQIEPLWFSSENEIDFNDMMLRDVQNDGLTDLLILQNHEILLYQWIGNRFVLDHVLSTNIQDACLEDALFKYPGKK